MGRYVRHQGNPKLTFFIVVIGGLLAIFLDLFVFGGWQYIKPSKPVNAPVVIEEAVVEEKTVSVPLAPQYVPVEEYFGFKVEDYPYEEEIVEVAMIKPPEVVAPPVVKKRVQQDNQYWERYAASFEPAAGDQVKPRVIFIIDDLGLNVTRSKKVVDLPAPLTLAYLPYADGLKAQTEAARAAGHELLIHTPMEPMGKAYPGPGALMDDMSVKEIEAAFSKTLNAFEGYIGINNHMGSRLTQNPEAMKRVMQMLKDRGLVFVDSVTAAGSVAADIARAEGIYYAKRDVFLDHKDTPEYVRGALLELEATARRNGVAIAIGHPKDVTIAALREWIPTLEGKGLVLAPVSSVLEVDKH
jgi:polysaccharide deacetylase 2 family uncharacterized protein YibQ